MEIDPEGAQIVRLIFTLYLEGDGKTGPLGIKNIVSYLNERGYRTPKDNRFHVSFVGKILTDEIYIGRAWYGMKDSRTQQLRPREEWVLVNVPPIVSEEDFQRVQLLLRDRAPSKTPPRLVNSPIILTGVARCGGCGSPLQRYTGKNGAYSYYGCSEKRNKGSCSGGAPAKISATTLDQIVLDHLLTGLLTAERVQQIVGEVAARAAAGRDDIVSSVEQLRQQIAKSKRKLQNLINAIAEGVVESGPTIREAVKTTEAECERLAHLLAVQERLLAERIKPITLERADEVAGLLRERLTNSAPSLRKRIVRSFVGSVLYQTRRL